jgi:tubulin--tyrosine ligase
MLIEKRKFDLRVFALFTAHAESGMLRGYYYTEGYVRTSCKEYDATKIENRLIHLTNDAV